MSSFSGPPQILDRSQQPSLFRPFGREQGSSLQVQAPPPEPHPPYSPPQSKSLYPKCFDQQENADPVSSWGISHILLILFGWMAWSLNPNVKAQMSNECQKTQCQIYL